MAITITHNIEQLGQFVRATFTVSEYSELQTTPIKWLWKITVRENLEDKSYTQIADINASVVYLLPNFVTQCSAEVIPVYSQTDTSVLEDNSIAAFIIQGTGLQLVQHVGNNYVTQTVIDTNSVFDIVPSQNVVVSIPETSFNLLVSSNAHSNLAIIHCSVNFQNSDITCSKIAYLVNGKLVAVNDLNEELEFYYKAGESVKVIAIPLDAFNSNWAQPTLEDFSTPDFIVLHNNKVYKIQVNNNTWHLGDYVQDDSYISLGRMRYQEATIIANASANITSIEINDPVVTIKSESENSEAQFLAVAFELQENGSYIAREVSYENPAVFTLNNTGVYTFVQLELIKNLTLNQNTQQALGSGQYVWVDANDEIKITDYFDSKSYTDNLPSKTLTDLTELLGPISNNIFIESYKYHDINKIQALWECYYKTCEEILSQGCILCPEDIPKELIYKRDMLWMYLNLIQYATTEKQFWKLKKWIDKMENCNVLCDLNTTEDCGCNR